METKKAAMVPTPLTDGALLMARGWREVSAGLFVAPTDRDNRVQVEVVARLARRNDDAAEARDHGSVTYRATAEQKRSPILSALDGEALERDVIARLAERLDALETELCRALEAKASGR